MRLQYTKSCGVNLWQLLLAIAAVAVVIGLLPERIGIPIFLVVEGVLILALVSFLAVATLRKFSKK